jgi:uncharacterized protein (TIGR02646 family)
MNRIDRSKIDKPVYLVEKAEKWTKDLIDKRQSKPDYWNWHQYKNEKVEHILTNELAQITNHRCSYCDIRPVRKGALKPSIDHFKPKSDFPELAYEWTNLFLSCYQCQEYKGSSYPDIEPLKPDSCHYHFDYWFEIKWETYEILPNSLRDEKDQKRAEETIKWLGLNRDSRPISRGEIVEQFNGGNPDDWSYKFMLERK